MIKPWRAIRQVYQLHTRISLQNNNKIAVGHEWLCCMAFVDRPPKGDTSAHSVFENGRVRVCVHPRFMPMIMPTNSSYTPQHIHMAHTHTHTQFPNRGKTNREITLMVFKGVLRYVHVFAFIDHICGPALSEGEWRKGCKKGGCRKKTTQAKEMKEKRGKEKWKTQSVRYSFSCGLVNITWSPLWS